MDDTRKETIDVCFTIDEGYSQHVCVAMSSIVYNNPKLQLRVYLLFFRISVLSKRKIFKFCKRNGIELELIEVDNRLTSKFKVSGHGSEVNYLRIFIPQLLIKINKVLYLDSDTLVYAGIGDLFKLDIGSYPLAAVATPENNVSSILNIPSENYFNSGVLLMNLEYWRKNAVTEKLVKYILMNSSKITYWDQDALNSILHDSYLKIAERWNYLRMDISSVESVNIVHFAGVHKPWDYYCTHPFKSEYYKYLKFTPWRGMKPVQETFVYKLKTKIESIINFCRKLVFDP